MQTKLKDFFEKHSIQYILHKHPAVFTCEEAEEHCSDIPGIAAKNLFIREQKKDNFFLVVMPAAKRMNMKEFGKIIQVKKLTFAKTEELEEIMGLKPGAVSPFGLVNDTKSKVKLFIDQDLWNTEIVSFHPNVNTATLELNQANFRKYVNVLENKTEILELS